MTVDLEARLLPILRQLTLEPDTIDPTMLCKISLDDWHWMLDRAKAHRMLSHVHTYLSGIDATYIPKEIHNQLKQAHRRAVLRQMRIGRETVLLHQLLNTHQKPHLFLKGSVLSHTCYPKGMVRPMRDLDIIVPQGSEQDVQQCLITHAGGAIERYQHLEIAKSEGEKHLPPIWSPNREIPVEVHSKLFAPGSLDPSVDISGYMDDFWKRAETYNVAGGSLPCPAPSDQLVHIIIHGIYDHELNIGPLMVHDVRNLVTSGRINWFVFWQDLCRLKAIRGGILALKLSEISETHPAFHALKQFSPHTTTTIPDTITDTCDKLLLQDMDTHHERTLAANLMELRGTDRLKLILSKVFPNRSTLITRRTMMGLKISKGFYPILLIWFLWVRGRDFLRAYLHTPQGSQSSAPILQLRRWLLATPSVGK